MMKQRLFKFISLIICFYALAGLQPILAQTPIGGGGGDGGGPKQSWQDIYENPNLNPIFPTHDIQGRSVKYKDLCLMGERVRTKYKYVINPIGNTSKIIFDYLVTDRVRTVEVCREYNQNVCIRWEEETIEIPLTDMIEVFKKVKNDETDTVEWKLAFEKSFELQECEED